MSDAPQVRKGQAPKKLGREQFTQRFERAFVDPRFDTEREAIARLAEIAWRNYRDGRKAPRTEKAGAGFADPSYDLSVEWREARDRVRDAQARQGDPAGPSRVLVIIGSPRNDGTCPGESSKSFVLARLVEETLRQASAEVDVLDLSLLTSGYAQRIYPCKGCVSTAMPLCHWPCSCYPNHSLGQTGDWMAEIYERWAAAHGVIICAPVHWYQSPSALKLMMDRLVCADGGNADPTATQGKDAAKAKALELAGWDYPKHLAGRVYGLVIHGDVGGVEATRRNMADWLDWMGLIDAGNCARLDRYIGYYEPYATSHDALERDTAVQEEARNVARAVAAAVTEVRAGRLPKPGAGLRSPRRK
jgi:multimeric flavodoxin WrbA